MRIDVNSVEMHTLPVLPVRGVISLPNTEIRLEVGRSQSIEALEACEANGNYIVLVSQIDPNVEAPQNPIIDIGKTAEELNLAFSTVSLAVNRLVDAEILIQTNNANRNRVFAYEDYLAILRKDT